MSVKEGKKLYEGISIMVLNNSKSKENMSSWFSSIIKK